MANTYNADLQTNNASLEDVLNTINNLPEPLTINTCTVTVENPETYLSDIVYTNWENNVLSTIHIRDAELTSSFTLTNVPINSSITLMGQKAAGNQADSATLITSLSYQTYLTTVYKIEATANGSATIVWGGTEGI